MIERRGGDPLHPEGLTQAQEALSLQLYDIGVVKFGDFWLKQHDIHPEAPPSPLYLDMKALRRFPEAKAAVVGVYADLLRPLYFQLLADIPTAATPLVSSLSDRLGMGQITPRIGERSHGSGAKVDGMLQEDVGMTAVLIDDLVTRADSKIEAANILREQRIDVLDIVVLIDREQGGREHLLEAGYTLHSAFTLSQMLDFYLRSGVLTQEVYDQTHQRLAKLHHFSAKS
jgi:uridine monophosphate synthetase